jgi:Ig-like domain CHU_C associated/Secretion system C-terminal sorting domain
VTGSNISSVLTDDPGVAGSANPTNVVITLAAPTSPTISSTNICSGQSVTLGAISSIGTLNWWTASSGGTSVASGTPYSPININTAISYYASNIVGGCESARTLAGSVSIKPLPSATITATPTSICKNSTLNLSAPSGATTYSWAGNGIVTANANATTAVPNAAGTQTYSLTVTGSNSCTNSSTTDVIVNNLPTPIIAGATTGCEAISLLASGGVNYAWSGGATPATANNVVASSGAYTVTVTDGNNCNGTTSTTVTINPITFEGINLDPVTSKPIPQTSTYNLDGSNEHMYMGTDCNIIGKVMPFGASPAMGNTISKVWYEPTQPANFVRRHHEITPSANASTSTGKVKLYFTQQDFNYFNAVNAVKLPTGSGDATGISNILIEKLGGTSSDGSGLPNKYSGSTATINPDDTDIVWNATYSRWEITFSVDGFSGFFVKTQSALLPVELLSFKGQYTEGGNFLTWKTASENNNKGFEIERSVDGQLFTKIGWLEGHGNSNILNSYSYLDKNPPQSINYYRLKQLDNSDKSTYSNVISLANEKIFTLKVYPNPANDVLSLSINQTGEYPYSITDMLGQIVKKGVIGEQSNINISTLSPGTYFLKCNETFVKFVKNK